jgi:uncharacterized protein (TIGR04141 family)
MAAVEMTDGQRRAPLSISLTRPGIRLEDALSTGKLKERPSHRRPSEKSRFFTYEDDAPVPWWQDYLDLPPNDFRGARRFGAIVAVEVTRSNVKNGASQHIVFAFGMVRHLLKHENFVADFGLQLAAHGVVADQILAADTLDVSESRRQRTQLASGRQLDFIDPDAGERSVRRLTAAADDGFPGSPSVITGSESLRFSSAVPYRSLPRLAVQLFKAYSGRSNPVVSLGNIEHISDKRTVEQADAALLRAFLDGSGVHFAFPEIVDPGAATLISFRGSSPQPALDPFDLERYRSDLLGRQRKGRAVEVETLRNVRVAVSDAESDSSHSIALYRCLTGTVTVAGRTYALFEGRWYEVRADYLSRVDTELAALSVPPTPFLDRVGADHEEVDYNMRLAIALDGVFLDRTSLLREGHSKIEPCDILRLDGDDLVFTHVKPGNSSSTLSHLFYQAQVSAAALLLDGGARTELGRAIATSCARPDLGLPAPRKGADFTRDNVLTPQEKDRRQKAGDAIRQVLEAKITQRKFRAEFVILDGDDPTPRTAADLPVFSRVSLARAAREFRRLGVPLSLRIMNDKRSPKV